MMARAWRTRTSLGQRGFSLVELMVAIVVMGAVLAGMYMGLSNLQTTAAGASERMQNLDEGRVLMATVTKDIRTGTRLSVDQSPFTYADSRRLEFYANINTTTGPNRVNIFVDPQFKLVEQTIAPTASTPCPPCWSYTGTPTVRIVGRWIANSPTEPIFRFFDGTGAEIDGTTALDPTELKNVDSIEVMLMIRKSQRVGKPTTLINRVRLPNVDWNPLAVPSP